MTPPWWANFIHSVCRDMTPASPAQGGCLSALPELGAHDAAPHQLPVAQVVELAPLILAVQRDGVLLNGKVKVALHVLKASSEK